MKLKFLGLLISFLVIIGCDNTADKKIDVEPSISLVGPQEVFFNVNDSYIEYGYIAKDSNGKDVSHLVRRDASSLNMGKEGVYRISYTAVDYRGVKSEAIYRTVNVGSAFAPQISVSANNPMLLGLGREFTVPEATAFSYDGQDLSDKIVVDSSSVRTSQVGTYTVFYQVTDSTGATGKYELSVYVLESSAPRILVENNLGLTSDNPFLLQYLIGDSDAASYLNSALPYVQAFDLEDGDISYRVKLDEASADYAQLLTDIAGTGTDPEKIYEVALTVSDSATPTPNTTTVPFFIKLEADTTPPEIYIPNTEITMVVNVWEDQTMNWTKLLDEQQITVYDNSWTDSSPEKFSTTSDGVAPAGKTGLAVYCTVDASELLKTQALSGNLPLNPGYSEADIATTAGAINVTQFQEEYFNYSDMNSEVNRKKVYLKAVDQSGHETSAILTVKLVDKQDADTPPQFWSKTIQIPYGASAVSDDYRLRWYDNTGATGTATGFESISQIDNARVQGKYTVNFKASFNGSSTVDTPTVVTVLSPLKIQNGGKDYMSNNILTKADFTGQNYVRATEGYAQMTAVTPANWIIEGNDNFWTYYSSGDIDVSIIDSVCREDRNDLLCGGVVRNGLDAYMVSGCRYVDTNTWINNVQVSIAMNDESVILYEGVMYNFGYDNINYLTTGDNLADAGFSRGVSFSKKSGGTIGSSDQFSISGTTRDNGVSIGTDNVYELMDGHPSKGSNNYTSKWNIRNEKATISDGDIVGLKVVYTTKGTKEKGGGILGFGDKYYDEYGGLVTRVRVVPYAWKAKQNGTGTVGYNVYNLDSGTVAWQADMPSN